MKQESPFKVGKPIPKEWLDKKLDLEDRLRHLINFPITSQKEADRLTKKYCD